MAAGASSSHTAATPPAPYGVRLTEAAEAVRATIAAGTRDGYAQARIQLAPVTLGAIQIHLQRTPDGVVARVITEHPEAARALAQSSHELRRSLESSGTTLLRLDIGSSDRRDTPAQREPATPGWSGGSSGRDDEPARPDDDLPTDPPVQSLPGAALVNVLA